MNFRFIPVIFKIMGVADRLMLIHDIHTLHRSLGMVIQYTQYPSQPLNKKQYYPVLMENRAVFRVCSINSTGHEYMQ